MLFEGRYRFTKNQLAQFYKVDVSTIERLLENHDSELAESGYELFFGPRLWKLRLEFAAIAEKHDVSDIDVGDMVQIVENELLSSRAPSVGIFTHKAF